MPGPFAEPM
jgi:hypothetical protein